MNYPIFYLICQIKVGFMRLVPFTHFLQSFHNLKCQILCFFSFPSFRIMDFRFFLCILHNFFSIFLLKTSFFYNFSYVFLCFSHIFRIKRGCRIAAAALFRVKILRFYRLFISLLPFLQWTLHLHFLF